jgi:hypothetical protein
MALKCRDELLEWFGRFHYGGQESLSVCSDEYHPIMFRR